MSARDVYSIRRCTQKMGHDILRYVFKFQRSERDNAIDFFIGEKPCENILNRTIYCFRTKRGEKSQSHRKERKGARKEKSKLTEKKRSHFETRVKEKAEKVEEMEIDYSNQQRREETFSQWSISEPGAKHMACAGFRFTGRQLFFFNIYFIPQIVSSFDLC